MKHIDEAALEHDLTARFHYLAEFIGFGEEDIKTVLSSAPLLAPLVPGLVDAVYNKLFQQDATARHFVPKQFGYEGQVPLRVEDLTHDHPMIQFRKSKLTNYLVRLVTGPYDGKMVQYLDWVGKIHTKAAGSPELEVPLIQMNALMGFVADALVSTLLGANIDDARKHQLVRSFNKLLWIQNDLITRHYQK